LRSVVAGTAGVVGGVDAAGGEEAGEGVADGIWVALKLIGYVSGGERCGGSGDSEKDLLIK
jgi:hypothetical protein